MTRILVGNGTFAVLRSVSKHFLYLHTHSLTHPELLHQPVPLPPVSMTSLLSLQLYLTSKYGVERVAALFAEIQRVVVRALQSVQKVMVADETSFALYGYDILIDDNLKVHSPNSLPFPSHTPLRVTL